ncbi:hypothetical protein GCM10009000_085660 [Halobacterium noricense]|uniref:Uncharacterized protein n=1 Tax=Haladaptatus pallidirubidus TaxID=1008152 RepID=A0AAV3URQ7_9EURY
MNIVFDPMYGTAVHALELEIPEMSLIVCNCIDEGQTQDGPRLIEWTDGDDEVWAMFDKIPARRVEQPSTPLSY